MTAVSLMLAGTMVFGGPQFCFAADAVATASATIEAGGVSAKHPLRTQ